MGNSLIQIKKGKADPISKKSFYKNF